MWWEALERQPPGHARLEVVAARSPAALAAFDAAVAAAGPPLETALRTRVPPGARVLVAGEGPLPQAEHREVVPFTAGGVEDLEEARRDGATHLAIPAAAAEWFEGQPELRRHVRSGYPRRGGAAGGVRAAFAGCAPRRLRIGSCGRGDRSRGLIRPAARARADDRVRQPRLHRAAVPGRLPGRLSLRARPPGGGRGRDGGRLRPGARGRPALVNLHTAPGVGNAMGAIFNAHENKAPLVITAGQQVRAMMTMEALLTNPDPVVAAAPVREVELRAAAPAGRAGRAGARAFHLAQLPPRGPVFVSVPMDDWSAEADEVAARQVTGRSDDRAAPPRTRRRWRTSRAGSRARRTRCWSPAPTSTPAAAGTRPSRSPSGAGCRCGRRPPPAPGGVGFPEDHPNFQGLLPPAIAPLAQTLEPYDLVLVVGRAGVHLLPVHPRARSCPRAPRSCWSRTIRTRRPARRRATRSWRTWRSRSRRCWRSAETPDRPPPAGAARRPSRRRTPSPIAALRRRWRRSARCFPADGDRRERVALEHDRVPQPGAAVAARRATSRRRRRARVRPACRGRRAARAAGAPGGRR